MEPLPPEPKPSATATATATTAVAANSATTGAVQNEGGVQSSSDSDQEDFVDNARQLERPWFQASPTGWTQLGFVKHPQNWDRLYRRLSVVPKKSILRLPGNMPRKAFVERCERLNIPCILEGCMKRWPALTRWSWEALKKRFPDVCWRVSDTHGATLSMAELDAYCASTQVRESVLLPKHLLNFNF